MADNKIVPGSIPAGFHTNKEAGYETTIRGKKAKEDYNKTINKAASNPATPGYVPPTVHTTKEAGYTTKGNAEKTRRTDKTTGKLESAGAALSNLGASLLGDRAYDYRGYSDEELEEMIKKNPNSADAADAQRELNKRNEAAGMAKKPIMIKGANGEMKDMQFSTGHSISDADTFGDIKAEDIPDLLREKGYNPNEVSREDAVKILKGEVAPKPVSKAAPAPSTAPTANTAPEAMSAGISTDEPTDDLSTPEADWKSTDEIYETMKDDINNKAAATPEMKSIWSAWKNGDIDKATRNYFIADALAKFAGDMGNISHAQHANNMWANIESGNQINPMENIKGDNQWQDYLKTDWKEAQKLKNEARSKEQLGNVDINLEITKKAGLDNYYMNTRPELMKNSKMAKLSKENPDLAASVFQLCAISDGKAPYNGDDLVNLTRTKEAIDQALKMGDETVKQMGTTTEILGLQKKMTEAQAEYARAAEEAKIAATKGGAAASYAAAALTNAQTRLQNVANEVAEKTKGSEIMGKQIAPYLNAANTALLAVNTFKPF